MNITSTSPKDFQLISKLGEGSYSSVYKVRRISDNEIYAFKKVRMNLLNDKEKENALNEVRILASITDPYIIGYKESFFDDDSNSLCIVMEYADGGDLQKKIQSMIDSKTSISETIIWQCLIQMTQGLKTLHDMQILHRDLKCANIFLSQGMFKLGDLNVSKVARKGLVYTQTGTPYYASPEVWRDEAYDMKSDIWSLGCVVYELASLKPPFRANDMSGLYKKVQKGVFDRIPKIYSEELQYAIAECLKVQASFRPNCNDILKMNSVVRYCEKFNLENKKFKGSLLETINLPKNLRQLKEILPKANYEKKYSEKIIHNTRKIELNERKKSENMDLKNLYIKETLINQNNNEQNEFIRKGPIRPTSNKEKNRGPSIQKEDSNTRIKPLIIYDTKNLIKKIQNSPLLNQNEIIKRPNSRDRTINILNNNKTILRRPQSQVTNRNVDIKIKNNENSQNRLPTTRIINTENKIFKRPASGGTLLTKKLSKEILINNNNNYKVINEKRQIFDSIEKLKEDINKNQNLIKNNSEIKLKQNIDINRPKSYLKKENERNLGNVISPKIYSKAPIKIISKEKPNTAPTKNGRISRVALGQQILNNNYHIVLKNKK